MIRPKECSDVIRIRTEAYCNSRNEVVVKKTIRQMRSMSEPPYALEEEISQVGVEGLYAFDGILDLPDGLYRVYIKHMSRDFWSGAIDDVEYGLTAIEDFPPHDDLEN